MKTFLNGIGSYLNIRCICVTFVRVRGNQTPKSAIWAGWDVKTTFTAKFKNFDGFVVVVGDSFFGRGGVVFSVGGRLHSCHWAPSESGTDFLRQLKARKPTI